MANKKQNKVRVIAGLLRGRTITFADSPGLRPTGDRLRETLFSWLQPFIAGSRVLDLFAGSGALGFESFSRGARHVTMVEKSRKVCAGLRQSVEQLEVDEVAIICADALDLASNFAESGDISGPFDIIFVDPPFGEHLHQMTIDMLLQSQWLAKDSLLVIESDRRAAQLTVPTHWQLQKQKTAGEVQLQLYLVQ